LYIGAYIVRFETSYLLQELIGVIIEYQRVEKNEYVFGKRQQVYSESYRTGLVNEAFESATNREKISVNILRKLYVDWKRREGELEWTTSRRECGRQLGHSVEMQQNCYKKREHEGEAEERKVKQNRRHATKEEHETLKTTIKKWDDEKRGGYKWKKMWEENEILNKIPQNVVKRWGMNLVKNKPQEDVISNT
jgi:hypothetical protein